MHYDKTQYKIWNWKSPAMLHWILNPALFINELIFGQRVPRILLFDKNADKPMMERQWVPCPDCHTLHDGRLWSKKKAFGNWFGYYCPHCGGIIPCLRNIFSWLLLAISFPLWIGFASRLKASWLLAQKKRFKHTPLEFPAHAQISWLKMGLTWGGIMFLLMGLAFPLLVGQDLHFLMVVIHFFLWLAAGMLFGYTMKWILGRRKRSPKTYL